MKRRLVIALAGLILVFGLYKWLRDTFWIVKDSTFIDEALTVSLEYDSEFFAWLDRHVEKSITVHNLQTGSELNIRVSSQEHDLLFFVDTVPGEKVLRVFDVSLGQNVYRYSTLDRLLHTQNCLVTGEDGSHSYTFSESCPECACGVSSIQELNNPVLKYSRNGFER